MMVCATWSSAWRISAGAVISNPSQAAAQLFDLSFRWTALKHKKKANGMISISIVDDERALRESIATFVNGSAGIRCVSTYGSARAALEGLPADRPDVVLMDINMAGMTGIQCVAQLREIVPAVQIVMLTVYEDTQKIFKALAAGASGYLFKQAPPPRLLQAP